MPNSICCPLGTYFHFCDEIDTMEVLSTLELIFGMYDGEAHKDFYTNKHSDLIMTTMFKNLRLTVALIPEINLKGEQA